MFRQLAPINHAVKSREYGIPNKINKGRDFPQGHVCQLPNYQIKASTRCVVQKEMLWWPENHKRWIRRWHLGKWGNHGENWENILGELDWVHEITSISNLWKVIIEKKLDYYIIDITIDKSRSISTGELKTHNELSFLTSK